MVQSFQIERETSSNHLCFLTVKLLTNCGTDYKGSSFSSSDWLLMYKATQWKKIPGQNCIILPSRLPVLLDTIWMTLSLITFAWGKCNWKKSCLACWGPLTNGISLTCSSMTNWIRPKLNEAKSYMYKLNETQSISRRRNDQGPQWEKNCPSFLLFNPKMIVNLIYLQENLLHQSSRCHMSIHRMFVSWGLPFHIFIYTCSRKEYTAISETWYAIINIININHPLNNGMWSCMSEEATQKISRKNPI